MLESLSAALGRFGLELNGKKTKVMTTEPTRHDTQVITECGAIDISHAASKHKYLGRWFTGDLKKRGRATVEHRIGCARMKFNAFQHVLTNKHVSISLRFKLFEAVLNATLCYSHDSCPLTDTRGHRLDVLWRRMLRCMVGVDVAFRRYLGRQRPQNETPAECGVGQVSYG